MAINHVPHLDLRLLEFSKATVETFTEHLRKLQMQIKLYEDFKMQQSQEIADRNKKVATDAGSTLQYLCFNAAKESGWWTHLHTDEPLHGKYPDNVRVNIAEKLALIHSEVSEALEGARKNVKDSHLPDRWALEVELADAAIRIFDLAGGLGLDLGGAIAEKLDYNAKRADHKLTNRRATNGKQF